MSITTNRPLCQIAAEIRADWTDAKINFAAKPYLFAMMSLQDINSPYGADNGKTIVLYFLSNASSWRGDVAKRIKAELKKMVGLK
jgi:hypothetical protein